MTWTGPVPNSLTSESDQRAEYDANLAAQREHVAEASPGPRIYTRMELVDELRRMALNWRSINELVGYAAICSQAADELARYDAAEFKRASE